MTNTCVKNIKKTNSFEIIKRYITKGKMVILMRICDIDSDMYCFKINDKCSKKDYYSDKYSSFEQCEKDSYKVVKGI